MHDEHDTSAHGHGDASSHDHGDTCASNSAHEERRRMHILRNAPPQTIWKYKGRFVIHFDRGRAFEVGGCNYASGCISVAKIARKMEEYDRIFALNILEHPELPPPPSKYPTNSCLGFQTWYDVARGKRKNGRVYDAGGYAKTIKQYDRSLRMRLVDGEGTSHPLIITADMLETVRNLAHTEAAARNAEIEEMRRRQAKMEEELRRKTMEYEESMRVANERA
ncbi:hypothetical protein KIW84_021129 [Lathyrus oleraceus]|uniref:Uncharacterized protein n=1 Tax=Pisum sativum TaxID=3888 RepID=A0A9D5B8V5_PEA|nr:hypothetical protein KIW84_021129 [Pisum sativum]